VNYITVYITAGQSHIRGSHFRKYILLGSTGKVVGGFSIGGCPLLTGHLFLPDRSDLWIKLWITLSKNCGADYRLGYP
jgi:hypothetical protein